MSTPPTSTIQTDVPLVNVPFVDLKTGVVTETWFLFLIQLFRRSGGSSGIPPNSLTVADVLALEELFSPAGSGSENEFEMEMAFPPIVPAQYLPDSTFAPAADTGYAQSAGAVTLGASPATYVASYRQGFHITGGTVSALSMQRGATVLPLAPGSQIVELSPGDAVTVTYSVAPTVTILPR
jgi:hypothetical protein